MSRCAIVFDNNEENGENINNEGNRIESSEKFHCNVHYIVNHILQILGEFDSFRAVIKHSDNSQRGFGGEEDGGRRGHVGRRGGSRRTVMEVKGSSKRASRGTRSGTS